MRSKNTMMNVSVLLVGQAVGILVSFVSRTLFLYVLNAEYLGVNGLFTDVLSILSLAEMGFGPAIVYSLYKPIAENDEKKVKELMGFYALAYKAIGTTILVLGIALMPFLDLIITDAPAIDNLNFIYMLYLLNAVVSYFYNYKRSLITANQKEYIISLYSRAFFIAMTVVQIVILFLTGNFILFLIVRVIFTFIENFIISRKADNMYPFLKGTNNERIDLAEKRKLFKSVKAMVAHRLGSAVVQGTDNILISTFVGIRWVGLYSNYALILNGVLSMLNPVLSSVTASVGNLNVLESEEKSFSIFKTMFLINFWLYGFSAIALWVLFAPFISLWIGSTYLLSPLLSLVIVINFYIGGMRKTSLVFRDSAGLFYNDRFKPVAEGIINLFASILLARSYGMIGILLGTLISTLSTAFWVEPYIVYKHIFKKKAKDYFTRYSFYTSILVFAAICTKASTLRLTSNSIGFFILKLVLVTFIPNSIFFIVFRKSDEFKYLKNMLNPLIKKAIHLKHAPAKVNKS